MSIGLLGKKIGMTQIFMENGRLLPVTVIETGPCSVLQVKIKEKDGYDAIQYGFDKQKESRLKKSCLSKFKKIKVAPVKFIREICLKEEEKGKYKIGDEVKVDIFQVGDFVDIAGVSIGKGFQGVMKRWNFKGHPASHGATIHRAPGSIGASATPSRVVKGKKMPGRMGHDKVTTQNLKVLKVDKENNLLMIKGAVPGSKGGYLIIRLAKKKKRAFVDDKKQEAKEIKTETAKENKKK